jgi:hypothetical protein
MMTSPLAVSVEITLPRRGYVLNCWGAVVAESLLELLWQPEAMVSRRASAINSNDGRFTVQCTTGHVLGIRRCQMFKLLRGEFSRGQVQPHDVGCTGRTKIRSK